MREILKHCKQDTKFGALSVHLPYHELIFLVLWSEVVKPDVILSMHK